MKILLTGGAGYIGSHVAVELLRSGYEIVIADNFSNSSAKVLDAVKKITGKDFLFYQADVTDPEAVRKIFAENRIECVIHFAAFKSVGESVHQPLKYYENNLGSLITVCKAMREAGCNKLIFSSSATVYGLPKSVPIDESFPLSTTNPYGTTKLFAEQILRDVSVSDPDFRVALLRYFNPIGADESGLIGESPNDIPSNLLPYVSMVADGRLEKLSIFGNDYATKDGTGVRDYIHVTDLALGHVAAIQKLIESPGVHVYNLGTGKGYSVLDIVAAMEKASGKKIPYVFAPRRPGDVGECYNNPEKANRELHWKATRDLETMCRDAWRWQQNNR